MEEAEVEGGLLDGLTFSQLLSIWWEELCNDVHNPAWGENAVAVGGSTT